MAKPTYGSQYSDADAKCPFYKAANDKKKTLICEGVFHGTQIRFLLKQKARYAQYRQRYCDSDYFKDCAYFKAASAKYEEETGGV